MATTKSKKLAREIVNEVLEFGRDDEDIAVNGYDKQNRDRLVSMVSGILQANPARVIELVVRDPDYENEYVTAVHGNVEIEHIEIDIGGEWNGFKDLAARVHEGHADALAWVEEARERVAHLPKNSAARKRVEDLCRTAETYYD